MRFFKRVIRVYTQGKNCKSFSDTGKQKRKLYIFFVLLLEFFVLGTPRHTRSYLYLKSVKTLGQRQDSSHGIPSVYTCKHMHKQGQKHYDFLWKLSEIVSVSGGCWFARCDWWMMPCEWELWMVPLWGVIFRRYHVDYYAYETSNISVLWILSPNLAWPATK